MSTSTGLANAEHWNKVYETRGADQVSWFQPEPTVSVELIGDTRLDRTQPVIDVGGGASLLVDRLLERGHTDLTVLDVSGNALRLAQRRLAGRANQVSWETSDLLRWRPRRRFALWHDRAVFHFLTDPSDRDRYRELASASVLAGGYLVLATFAADGPEHCSGLPVARYSPEELVATLGAAFNLLTIRREHHRTPAGVDQPFTWLLMRRTDS